MCGIIGQLNFSGTVDREIFDAMRDTLTHRGPDGYGTELRMEGQLALGHRRLSILDLSERGHQPMANEDGTVWITFNGEIYNYGPLRQELLNCGHVFRSTSDTEVLVHGYEEWGLDALLGRIKGMFAFGLWDENRRKLFVVRDRFGIKPLVYHADGNRFVFASEIKAVTRDPAFRKEIRQDALADFFIYSYIPHPHTVYEGLHKLRPAHYLEVDADTAKQRLVRYWSLNERVSPLPYAEASERMNELLCQSVREHLVSDVPVGLFLSGGYDSSSVLMHMHDLQQEVDAFSLGFAGSERSEHLPAAEIAAAFDARHHVKLLEYED
ncbi:MAG: asparagine synthase (glutamine-hydrolyzing), partial [Lewinella sp.]